MRGFRRGAAGVSISWRRSSGTAIAIVEASTSRAAMLAVSCPVPAHNPSTSFKPRVSCSVLTQTILPATISTLSVCAGHATASVQLETGSVKAFERVETNDSLQRPAPYLQRTGGNRLGRSHRRLGLFNDHAPWMGRPLQPGLHPLDPAIARHPADWPLRRGPSSPRCPPTSYAARRLARCLPLLDGLATRRW